MTPPTSHLKNRPLPTPGESGQQRFQTLLEDRMLLWVGLPIWLLVMAAVEWWRYAFDVKPAPFLTTTVALLACFVAAFPLRKAIRQARQLKRGYEGELVVGQFLETLRADGYQVFHDISEDGYNIDHVIIGPAGVFAIETKVRSKPNPQARVEYDGQEVRVAGYAPDRDPLHQVEANARRVAEILRARTGRSVFVRPVVIYHNWYVQVTCRSPRIWVVNERYLVAWIDREALTLTNSDVALYSDALASYVRSNR